MTDRTAGGNGGADLLVRREGRIGRLTLNRPKVLNALTLGMVRALAATLEDWRDDPGIEIVVLEGAGERGLCAGGDVRALHGSSDARTQARTFWREEYALNAVIARYPKPYIALMDGIVMGGGMGLSAHGNIRLVTERSKLAMPETALGLVPDVGGTWLLSRAPGQVGTCLALTGRHLDAADAIFAGLADRKITSSRIPELFERLANPFSGPLQRTLDALTEPAGASALAAEREAIDAVFGESSLERMIAVLNARGDAWSRRMLETLADRSPIALKLTLAALRRARSMCSLEEALNLEYRLTCRLNDSGEFAEGVRALLIDKDRKPRWNPPTLAGVTEAMLASFLAPMLPGEDLTLAPPG